MFLNYNCGSVGISDISEFELRPLFLAKILLEKDTIRVWFQSYLEVCDTLMTPFRIGRHRYTIARVQTLNLGFAAAGRICG